MRGILRDIMRGYVGINFPRAAYDYYIHTDDVVTAHVHCTSRIRPKPGAGVTQAHPEEFSIFQSPFGCTNYESLRTNSVPILKDKENVRLFESDEQTTGVTYIHNINRLRTITRLRLYGVILFRR